MDPSGKVDRIYKEDHYTLVHTKYESSGPCGFGEDFFMFSHCKSSTVNSTMENHRQWRITRRDIAEFLES